MNDSFLDGYIAKKLPTAWRDLAGWHEGMVLKPKHERSIGGVVFRVERTMVWVTANDGTQVCWDLDSRDGLPDHKHRANIGVWLGWVADRLDRPILEVADEASCENSDPAAALLEFYIHEGFSNYDEAEAQLPQSVRDWAEEMMVT